MRVPYAQFLGKVPFKAVVIVLGAGAAAAWRLVRTRPMVLWGRA